MCFKYGIVSRETLSFNSNQQCSTWNNAVLYACVVMVVRFGYFFIKIVKMLAFCCVCGVVFGIDCGVLCKMLLNCIVFCKFLQNTIQTAFVLLKFGVYQRILREIDMRCCTVVRLLVIFLLYGVVRSVFGLWICCGFLSGRVWVVWCVVCCAVYGVCAVTFVLLCLC